MADTYAGPWLHSPGRVFTDLAVAVADGADCVSRMEVLTDRQGLFGPALDLSGQDETRGVGGEQGLLCRDRAT